MRKDNIRKTNTVDGRKKLQCNERDFWRRGRRERGKTMKLKANKLKRG